MRFSRLNLQTFVSSYAPAVDPTSTANRNDGQCRTLTVQGNPTDAAYHCCPAAAPYSNKSNFGKSAPHLHLLAIADWISLLTSTLPTSFLLTALFFNFLLEQKHGFKCANKQLVVRKDGLGVIGVNAPLSPTNDAKRLKIVKKKSYAQATSLTSTSIYAPSSSLISGPGFNSSNITLAGECKPTGGISDTGTRNAPLVSVIRMD
jgi:hypothetical protein